MIHLTDAEKKLMDIIWKQNNIPSNELVRICMEQFEWKKSTTYTMLKKLIKKDMVTNQNTIVSFVISKEDYMYSEKKNIIEKYFNNSLPAFLNTFARESRLTKDDIQELEGIIEQYRED